MITGHTGLVCLLGSPCAHSISPMMHNAAFKALGLDYRYLAFDVNEEALPAAVDGLKVLHARGFNLTMPDKNRMVSLCDRLSPAASLIGAVNTVVNDDGVLTGHNTDGVGYMMSVKHAGHDIIGKKMTLLGAGGAATAILVQAALDGVAEISVFLRSTSRFYRRAEETAQALSSRTGCRIRLCDFSDTGLLKSELKNSAILTNATSIGMAPETAACPVPDPRYCRKASLFLISSTIPGKRAFCRWLKTGDAPPSTVPSCFFTRVLKHSVSGQEKTCPRNRSGICFF